MILGWDRMNRNDYFIGEVEIMRLLQRAIFTSDEVSQFFYYIEFVDWPHLDA